jgi:aryl-alcohol dehydrogenase-like predicted oxidoreductase
MFTDEGLGVIPYYSLASGFLSGKYRSDADLNKSPRGQGIKKYLDERGLRILAAMDKVGREQNVPLSQLAISWLLHKPYITSPIASATSEEQLRDLIHATTLQLSKEQINELDEAGFY